MKFFRVFLMVISLLPLSACLGRFQHFDFVGPLVYIQEFPVETTMMAIHEFPTYAPILGQMPKSQFVRNDKMCTMTPTYEALAYKTELWCQVNYQGIEGWVKAATLRTEIVEEQACEPCF